MAKTTPPSIWRPEPSIGIIHDDFKDRHDVIGDLHGCYDEAVLALEVQGHKVFLPKDINEPALVSPAHGRSIVFLGDITDRGPQSVNCMRLVEGALLSGQGYCVMGNHDAKLLRAMAGNPVSIEEGLQKTLDEMEPLADETKVRWMKMIKSMPHQLKGRGNDVLSGDGYVTFVHGAAPAHHQDQENKNSLSRGLYGYPDPTIDTPGFLFREDWAAKYEGERSVFHGHTPVPRITHKNRVICVDTGSVFGGHMSVCALDTQTWIRVPSGVCAKTRDGITRENIKLEDPIVSKIHPDEMRCQEDKTSTTARKPEQIER